MRAPPNWVAPHCLLLTGEVSCQPMIFSVMSVERSIPSTSHFLNMMIIRLIVVLVVVNTFSGNAVELQ